MADMKRSLALLTSQQPAAVPSAPQQPAAPTPAPAKATPANASSYAAKAARAPKPGTHVPAVRAKPPAPTTARTTPAWGFSDEESEKRVLHQPERTRKL
ncbi:hypothetical protein AURDEDRAFT_176789 [Auricularia subglabra TFB-10046 SS5]|uniref:Uncharacterized protein n=1 Tax=Auricularia subglabra (strain TFB-10046 / SS5) TaxID=717982 RepID=J0CUW0_AURST|nr:hypothetical protein AURDEDRAFT_176789 [Auricularia subglabra TFB-10046 SS5]